MTLYKLGLLEGDGIGPEIIQATARLVNAALEKQNVKIKWVELLVGWKGIREAGHPLPDETIAALKQCHGWVLGPHDSASYPEKFKAIRNPSGELRRQFDLFANIRPAKTLPGIHGVVKEADLIIYRENTEGFYVDRNMFQGVGEFQVTKDVVLTTGVFTRQAIERIAHAAFQKAMQRKKKVTIVHKANVIRMGSGMFLEVCKEIAKSYPEVEVDDYHMDAMCAHVVRRMPDFDIIVTENMFGDILSDLTGELIGSLGLAPSINANKNFAMAQAAHGSAPDIAGKDLANPIGMMLSTALLLEWMSKRYADSKLKTAGKIIEKSLYQTLAEGITTTDLGGDKGTEAFTNEVLNRLLS
ncbi:isocitrate/isopropylmalate dehydrogenase family protein [Oceanobacillus timonensis]|uniref:isocitrate/isopropylmalate dehydrogenase family protein n=1 Tax=Oceanobacillus timonensis TaxID=1926285 RepID=UPI0009B9BBCC|nr:isocitrate/isopropylmalate dehydrogenase family protein [Oceanobacillus timonensis]